LYSYDSKKTVSSTQTKSEQVVKFTIIQESKPKQEPIKKVVKKEIPKKVEKKTIKKIVKKIEKKVKKEIVKKEIIKKVHKVVKEVVVKKQIKKNKSSLIKEKNNLDEKNKRKHNQKIYYTKIKELINKNKYYPKVAARRGIEGFVKINFTISQYGELVSFKMLEGKRIFKKSIQEAVINSFPLKPPKGLLTSNTQLSLKIAYRLY
jgi:protein TonB